MSDLPVVRNAKIPLGTRQGLASHSEAGLVGTQWLPILHCPNDKVCATAMGCTGKICCGASGVQRYEGIRRDDGRGSVSMFCMRKYICYIRRRSVLRGLDYTKAESKERFNRDYGRERTS
jgi:hypothetical protein